MLPTHLLPTTYYPLSHFRLPTADYLLSATPVPATGRYLTAYYANAQAGVRRRLHAFLEELHSYSEKREESLTWGGWTLRMFTYRLTPTKHTVPPTCHFRMTTCYSLLATHHYSLVLTSCCLLLATCHLSLATCYLLLAPTCW